MWMAATEYGSARLLYYLWALSDDGYFPADHSVKLNIPGRSAAHQSSYIRAHGDLEQSINNRLLPIRTATALADLDLVASMNLYIAHLTWGLVIFESRRYFRLQDLASGEPDTP